MFIFSMLGTGATPPPPGLAGPIVQEAALTKGTEGASRPSLVMKEHAALGAATQTRNPQLSNGAGRKQSSLMVRSASECSYDEGAGAVWKPSYCLQGAPF